MAQNSRISLPKVLYKLEKTISDKIDNDDDTSYTNSLYKRGINKVAQKVGEEAVELVIEAKDNDPNLFKNEGFSKDSITVLNTNCSQNTNWKQEKTYIILSIKQNRKL